MAPVGAFRLHDGRIVFTRHFPNPEQKILHTAAWDPRAALYSVRPNATGLRRLTPISGDIFEIAAAPDGSQIAYDAETYVYGKDPHVTGDQVHVMDANGAHNHTVYSCPYSSCSSLQWSPTGGRLLINGDTLLEPDGQVAQLCRGGCSTADAGESSMSGAVWSPDGQHLAFEDNVTVHTPGGTSTTTAIGVADADGSHIRQITNQHCNAASTAQCTYDRAPVWSPDSQRIAFVRLAPHYLQPDGSMAPGPQGPLAVVTVHADGTGNTQISACGNRRQSNAECRITSLAWAPDNNSLTFVETTFLPSETARNTVNVANPTSGSVETLPLRTHTSQPDDDWLAPATTWAPSGRQLALVSHQVNKPTGLYTVRLQHNHVMGSPTRIETGAYPPLTWLPTPR